MNHRLLAVMLLIFLSGLTHAQTGEQRFIRLSTLEWPPYTGLLLPQDGLSTRIVSVVSKAAGYRLLTASFEWSKTVEKGEKDSNFDGYFPVYFSKEREKNCHLSQPIGASVLGLATLKSQPLNWTNISDLSAYSLGVVEGYANGDEFDAAIKEKRQTVEAVSSDAINLTKLLQGKIRGVVIDKHVLNYTLSRTGGADLVLFNPKPIGLLPLHVCFKRAPAALEIRNAFDVALKTNDPAAIEAAYFKSFLIKR